MSTFGIIAPNCWSADSYYVGQDEVLWEWLQSDDFPPSNHDSLYWEWLQSDDYPSNRESFVPVQDDWEWLQSDDYPSNHESRYLVQAPVGYVFLQGSLHSLTSDVVKDANPEKLKDIAYVTEGSPQNDKVLRALNALQLLDRKNFNDCDIPEDRIIEILSY